MKRLIRRIVLSAAALSPSVAFLTVQELALSVALFLVGLTGAISVAVAVAAVSPKVNETLAGLESPNSGYPSLLTQAALKALQGQEINPIVLRAHLADLLNQSGGPPGFVKIDDQIAMILAQIMAQWTVTDAMDLSDDQARELYFVERLLRSSPADAGALASSFTTPDAMLAMRDRVANSANT